MVLMVLTLLILLTLSARLDCRVQREVSDLVAGRKAFWKTRSEVGCRDLEARMR